MLISWNWLQEYVTLPEGAGLEEAAEKLTMTGCEVEEMLAPCELLGGVVTAKIDEIKKHPSADNLFVVDLVMPELEATCITAATNLSVDDVVPYGPPGATLADGTILEKKDFSGVISEGMLLSADEVGIPEIADEFGILRLPSKTPLGMDFKSLFGLDDVLLDISVTPNRGDLLSITGLARELYAIFPGAKLSELPAPSGLIDLSWNHEFEGVTIHDRGCRNYALGLASDIVIKPSPVEARVKLALMGMRPISNVVDATNLVMLLTGQPLHAFDLDLLPARTIEVRSANEGETFTTLDEKEHKLSEKDLLITSGNEPVALAGVMGGLNSEIKAESRNVVIEAANFEAPRVSSTSRRLGINSEAAYRYSRGVDPQKTRSALFYALCLMTEWGEAQAYHTIKFSESVELNPVHITLRSSVLQRVLLWSDLDKSSEILERLGLKETDRKDKKDESSATFLVPTWRPDLEIEADLVEEVGRIRGYDQIKSKLPENVHSSGNIGNYYRGARVLRDMAMARGYTEVVTYSFLNPGFIKTFMLPEDDPGANPIVLDNPMSQEQGCMRTIMLPSLLASLVNSVRSGWRLPFRIFEMGRVYLKENENDPENKNHLEKEYLAGLVFPGLDRRSPYGKDVEIDFFSVKGDVIALLQSCGVKADFIPGARLFSHSGQTSVIMEDGNEIGLLFRLKPEIEATMDLSGPVYYFEIAMGNLLKGPKTEFHLLSQYPSVYRDISILVSAEKNYSEVMEDISRISGDLVKDIRLFDIYEGKGIPEGFKSFAFSLAYGSAERTLSDEEVDRVHGDLRKKLNDTGYTLR